MIELSHRCPWTIELAQLCVQLCRRHQGPRYNVNMRLRLRGRWTLSNLCCFWCARSHKCHISSAAAALIGPCSFISSYLAGFDWDSCVHVSANTGLCGMLRSPSNVCRSVEKHVQFMSASLEIQHSYVNTTYLFIYFKICIRPSEPACLVEWTPA